MNTTYNSYLEKAKDEKLENKKFLDQLKKKPPKKLDQQMVVLHEDTFEKIDCLQCANCCNTTSPIVTDKDTNRIAKHLKMKAATFEQQYLYKDSDGDFVFQSTPCPFLGEDNYCSIYEVRPKACSEYPHTDRKKFHQLNKITLENTLICPATAKIISTLKSQMGR